MRFSQAGSHSRVVTVINNVFVIRFVDVRSHSSDWIAELIRSSKNLVKLSVILFRYVSISEDILVDIRAVTYLAVSVHVDGLPFGVGVDVGVVDVSFGVIIF